VTERFGRGLPGVTMVPSALVNESFLKISGTSRMVLWPSDVQGATLVDRGRPSEGPGTKIGPYKILQQIGEGGFGVVYMAQREAPVQSKVALKIIKLGKDTRSVSRRSPRSPRTSIPWGVLKYRLGEYEASLETLARSHSYYSQEHAGGVPADLAFIAMAPHQLGRDADARAT